MDHGHTTPSPAYPGAPSPASASKPLQIIHLERRREDSLVVRNALEAEGLRCEILRVESRDEFLAAIKECRFDLVVADFFEPTLEGLELLRVVREIAPELLVIFFVADIKRELSDQAALAGAVGIVLKFDPVRLATAVLDALALNRVRAGQIFERVTLGDTELRLRKIAKSLGQAFWSVDARTGELLFANAEFKSLLGLPPHQLAQRRVKLVEFVHAEDRERVAQALGVEARTSEFQTEFRLAGADGETRWVWARMFPVLERGTLVRLAGTCEDITRRKT
ncbi:MAG TPA: PAS domain-containing protein, partial [Verrucomicrobiae bacterium]